MESNTEAIDRFLHHAPKGGEPGDMLVVPGWGQEEWSTLLSCTQPMELEAGEVLIQPRGEDRALYFVASGLLEVATIDVAGGGISALATIAPGSVVGELAFFDGAPRSAKVWAASPTRLLRFTLHDYERYAGQHPSAAAVFLFAMARLLSYRVRHTTARL